MNSSCSKCSIQENLISYPCQRFYCCICIIQSIYTQLLSLEFSLTRNIESYSGKFSYLSCIEKCEMCRLSMSMNTARSILSRSDLNPGQITEFIRLSYLGQSFFEGIPTNFFECIKCKAVSSAVKFFPLLCKSCIKDIVYQTVNVQLSDIVYQSCATQEEINNFDYIGQNFSILSYSNLSTFKYTFDCETIDGISYQRVFKPSVLSNTDFFILARSMRCNNVNLHDHENFIYIERDEDIQVLCVLIAII